MAPQFGLQTANQYFPTAPAGNMSGNMLAGMGMALKRKSLQLSQEEAEAESLRKQAEAERMAAKEERELSKEEREKQEFQDSQIKSSFDTAIGMVDVDNLPGTFPAASGLVKASVLKLTGGKVPEDVGQRIQMMDDMFSKDPNSLVPLVKQYQQTLKMGERKAGLEKVEGIGPDGKPGYFTLDKQTGKAERVEGVAPMPKSGTRMVVGEDGTVTFEQGPGVTGGGGMTDVVSRRKMETNAFNASERLSSLNRISAGYKPKYQDAWYKAQQGLKSMGEKYFKRDLDPKEKEELRAYTAHKRKLMAELALFIQSISGAAVSEQEAQRLKKAVPNEDDGPTVFEAKLGDVIEEQKLSLARYNYYLNKGMSPKQIEKLLDRDQQMSTQDIASIINNRGEQMEAEGLPPEQIRAVLKQEFGM